MKTAIRYSSFRSSHLFLMLVFYLFFNSCLSAQTQLFYAASLYAQYELDSLPAIGTKSKLKTNIFPVPEYKPGYRYYNPTYQKNKVSTVSVFIKGSNDKHPVFYQKYDRDGYLLEEICHSPPDPEFPDNRGHHFYTYADHHLLVSDSLIPDTSAIAIKQQYLFDANFRIVSHRVFRDSPNLSDSLNFAYDTCGNCTRIIRFYKNYNFDTTGRMFSDAYESIDTFRLGYRYTSTRTSPNTRSNGTYLYGKLIYGVEITSKLPNTVYTSEQTFDSLSRIMSIATYRSTVEFFYQENVIRMEVRDREYGILTYTFSYDKYGHLKKIAYFSQPAYSPDSARSKVIYEKIHFGKNGLLITNESGEKLIYTYYGE